MRFWPLSTGDRIRAAFAFLTEAHGYRLIADSDAGMGGSLAYRSPDLWITAEWDRGDPWLAFSATRSATDRFGWELVDHLLRGASAFDAAAFPSVERPADELAAWLRPRLADIEAHFQPPELERTHAQLRALEAEQRRLRELYWATHRPASTPEGEC